jgi:hypothetical protein
MACTLTSNSTDILDHCATLEAQISGLHALLTTIIPAISKKIVDGGVHSYTINTGQTIQTVRVDSMEDLIKNYRRILALYNELVQHFTGRNWIALRDESAFWYSRGC